MKHKVYSDEEIAKSGLLEEGVYDFTIIEATETTSKSGNDMFKLKLHVFDTEGVPRIVFDWILPEFAKKYKHIHDACGLMDLYQSGETKGGDLAGKSGKLMLGVGKPYTDQNGIERINNTVVDYVKRENMVPRAKAEDPLEGDEVPF